MRRAATLLLTSVAAERDSALAWARTSIERFGVSPRLDASKIPSVRARITPVPAGEEDE